MLIHFHGGHFRKGAKSREARASFCRLAAHGGICASANYRQGAAGRFPNSLIDAEKAIAWARGYALEYDADPTLLVVAGSSAGAHLAAMAALTPNDPAFQPGFAHQDTSVTAAVCLYGYYGDHALTVPPASPLAYTNAGTPPFFIAYGTNDIGTSEEAAAQFAEQLRGISTRPVVYAQPPGAARRTSLTCFAPCGW